MSYTVTSQPTASGVHFDNNVRMDFNIRLSGNGNIPCLQALAANDQFDFDVVKELEHAEIVWMHDQGQAVESYMIERSLDGINFVSTIADLASKGGDKVEVYHAYDFEPAKGDNYYRVKMNLVGGNVEYSTIKKINYTDIIDFAIFPNPANQFTKLNLESIVGKQNVTISIFNNLGNTIEVVEIEEVYSKYYQMDLRGLKEGHYTLWLTIPDHKPIAKQLVIGRL